PEQQRTKFSNWLKAHGVKNSGSTSSYIKALDLLKKPLGYNIFETTDAQILGELYQDLINNQRDKEGKYYNHQTPSYGDKGFFSAAVQKYINFLSQTENFDKFNSNPSLDHKLKDFDSSEQIFNAASFHLQDFFK